MLSHVLQVSTQKRHDPGWNFSEKHRVNNTIIKYYKDISVEPFNLGPCRSTTSALRGSMHSSALTMVESLQAQVQFLTEQLQGSRDEVKSLEKDRHCTCQE